MKMNGLFTELSLFGFMGGLAGVAERCQTPECEDEIGLRCAK